MFTFHAKQKVAEDKMEQNKQTLSFWLNSEHFNKASYLHPKEKSPYRGFKLQYITSSSCTLRNALKLYVIWEDNQILWGKGRNITRCILNLQLKMMKKKIYNPIKTNLAFSFIWMMYILLSNESKNYFA